MPPLSPFFEPSNGTIDISDFAAFYLVKFGIATSSVFKKSPILVILFLILSTGLF